MSKPSKSCFAVLKKLKKETLKPLATCQGDARLEAALKAYHEMYKCAKRLWDENHAAVGDLYHCRLDLAEARGEAPAEVLSQDEQLIAKKGQLTEALQEQLRKDAWILQQCRCQVFDA